MQIWHKSSDIPADIGSTVVTIGIFDGVHKGHQVVVQETVKQARERGLKAVALTFDPHPRIVHNPDAPMPLITSLADRLERLEAAGIDAVFVQHYTLEYANQAPEEFIESQLVGMLHASVIVAGEDIHFGRQNTGDGQLLRTFGTAIGLETVIVDDVCNLDDGRRWSSTWVRDLLRAGDVRQAAEVLGRPHRIRGIVQHGFKRGRQLGFPTANLPGVGVGEIPADGVYAGWLVRTVPETKATEHLPAAISIGTNPHFDGVERTVEAHVLGRSDLNLYGEEVAIDFIDYVRPMMSFGELDGLLCQMDDDLRTAADVLSVPVAGRVDPESVTAH
ncbi:bifunctional riboflavin kinase/FAD synthetase [Arcanobacterium buesumense]|uniref:Riboflavin biosynthesis protein n=1 Tax=Arcanobacterium buesumense TaxID=2722751 RepID=A0A6H2EKZ4_9ACTO|nr:bifunctional riboflavin kinase/FAD synthetase [Arcanobacterium buesumense]QJC21581.1 bifunctional riboflavin kinase/FAD synthetase [Arcanobacterium buesumense]